MVSSVVGEEEEEEEGLLQVVLHLLYRCFLAWRANTIGKLRAMQEVVSTA